MARDLSTSLSLLDRVRGKDPTAWYRLVHLYQPLVDYWCRRVGLNDADVEDVRQDVFQAVATSIDKFRSDRPGDTFRGWLRGITHHKLLQFWKRQGQPGAAGGSDAHQRLQQIPEPAELESDPPAEVAGLYHRALELVRGEFETRTWQAFYRTAVDGLSPNDVAAELGMKSAAVRQAKSRVLRRLKEEVGDAIE